MGIKTSINSFISIEKFPQIDHAFILYSKKHLDHRGWFQETYHFDKFLEHEINLSFVQDNLVYSNKNVLRGLHLQKNDGQGKLVSCIKGKIFDVFVDLRKDSKSYKKWRLIELNEQDDKFLYIPPGFAHGYYVIEEGTLVHYKCTKHYNSETEIGIRWDDPSININWPLSGESIISEKDKLNKTIKELNL